MCGQTITITANGKTAQATIMDLVSSLGIRVLLWPDLVLSVVPYWRRKLQLWGYGHESKFISILFDPRRR